MWDDEKTSRFNTSKCNFTESRLTKSAYLCDATFGCLMETQNTNPLSQAGTQVREYLQMRWDEAKLRGVEGLSIFFGRFITLAIVLMMILLALLFGGFAMAYLLGEWVGSNALGFAILGSAFLLLALIFFALRKKFLVDALVRFFVRLFFEDKNAQ